TGMATPTRVWDLVGLVREALPGVRLNMHFHDTRGTALANILAALELGVDEFDSSVGGLGGSPFAPGAHGNVATEDLVHMLPDLDASARHVSLAGQAVHLPGVAPAETYLNVEAVIEAARTTGAEAIHPGYGFLSERADAAEAVTAAGMVWVGPPAEATRAAGD